VRRAAAGAANGALFGLGPVFALGIGMTATSAPLFTSSIVLGSALGVLPIAAISDRIDRRLVHRGSHDCGRGFRNRLEPRGGARRLAACPRISGRPDTYSLYTLAVSLANDHGAPHDLIFIAVGLLFIYCVAAIAPRRWPQS
jgi:hypothetical protein